MESFDAHCRNRGFRALTRAPPRVRGHGQVARSAIRSGGRDGPKRGPSRTSARPTQPAWWLGGTGGIIGLIAGLVGEAAQLMIEATTASAADITSATVSPVIGHVVATSG